MQDPDRKTSHESGEPADKETEMKPGYYKADRVWKLPPLILHPFSDVNSPQKLVQSSRASLMLQGLLPNEEFTVEQLENTLLDGRYCEVRMLFYVGKDLMRWIDQCFGLVEREPELRAGGIEWQSFAAMLVDDPPDPVRDKLKDWGVADYRSIFARAIGLNAVFSETPDRLTLADEFVRNYHYYADKMYACWLGARAYIRIRSQDFDFELYASGEYSRILERQWQGGGGE
jgi:hypothetical protein